MHINTGRGTSCNATYLLSMISSDDMSVSYIPCGRLSCTLRDTIHAIEAVRYIVCGR